MVCEVEGWACSPETRCCLTRSRIARHSATPTWTNAPAHTSSTPDAAIITRRVSMRFRIGFSGVA